MGVVLGSLGHSYLFPYRGLIGCSPGVYAVMGGCVAMLIASGKHMDKGLQSILLLILLAQFFLDILAYFFLYMPNVGYAAHAYGYFTGFCTVMGFAVFYREAVWIKVLGIFAIGGLAYEISFLFHHFYNVWPPEPYEEDLFRNVDDFDCCRALFENADDDYALNKCYQ